MDDGVLAEIPVFFNALFGPDCTDATSVAELRDHFRIKQMAGKSWLCQAIGRLGLPDMPVLIVGGWLGFTAALLERLGYHDITDVDPDPRAAVIARHYRRRNPHYQRVVADVNDLDLRRYGLIINTCTEHISDDRWFQGLAPGQTVILQNTDWPEEDHVNGVASVTELMARYPMDLMYAGSLDLDQYHRFMTVGRKR